jgi:hypothetical protein
MSLIAYDVTCDMAVSRLMFSWKKSLTTHTPGMATTSTKCPFFSASRMRPWTALIAWASLSGGRLTKT